MTHQELLIKAEEQARLAQTRLDDALAAGSADTPRLREALDAAKARVAELEGIDALAEAEAAAKAREARRARAQAMAAEVQTAVQAELNDLLALPTVTAPTPSPDQAELLLLAEEVDQAATLAREDHQTRVKALETRRADLQAQRQTMVDRRLLGDQRPEDAATLGLLDADITGLADLIARTQAEEPPTSSKAAGWLPGWRTETAAARRQGIADVCRVLDEALARAVAMNRSDIGRGSAYALSAALRTALSRCGF